MFEQLLADGNIVAFGLTTGEIVTDEPGWHTSWYVTASADGMDAVEAAFDADWGAMDEEGRRARRLSVLETVTEGSYRSGMSEVLHCAVKAHPLRILPPRSDRRDGRAGRRPSRVDLTSRGGSRLRGTATGLVDSRRGTPHHLLTPPGPHPGVVPR